MVLATGGGDCSGIRPPDRGDTLGDEPNRGTLGGSSSDRGNLFSYDFLSKIKIWSGR